MFQKTVWFTFTFSLLYTILVAMLQYEETKGFELVRQSGLWYTLFYFSDSLSAFALHLLLVSSLVLITSYHLIRQTDPSHIHHFPAIVFRFGIPILIVFGTISAILLIDGAWKLLFMLILPGFYVSIGMILISKDRFGSSVGKTWDYFWGSFAKSLACFLVFILLGLFCIILTSSPLTGKVMDLIYWNISVSNSEIIRIIFLYLPTWIGYCFILITAQLLVISSCVLAFTLIETNQAGGLLNRIRALQNE